MAEPKPGLKRCATCQIEKTLVEFPVRSGSADGRRGACRDCCNEYYKRYRVKQKDPRGLGEEQPEPTEDEIETGLFQDFGNFGTQIERECAAAVLREGTVAEAARSLGLDPSTVRAHLSELQRRAATRGFATGHDSIHPLPPGFMLRGISTQYGPSGEIISKWVKTKDVPGDHKLVALMDALANRDTWSGVADPIAVQDYPRDEDLLNVFPIGDAHIGMLSWATETGNNFDLKIAEQNLFTAIDRLVAVAPAARQALVVNLGDFVHADGKGNTTTAGTLVDVDGRWAKIVSVAIRVLRRIVDRCLDKHDEVKLINEIGNHDANTSVMLSLCLAQFYEREPRVIVDTSPSKFHWHRFGKNLVGVTHGDTTKYKDLPGIMACDRPQDWGETLHRLWLCGHVHHDQTKELLGCKVETFRTLAPGDAWHVGQGYRSGRDSKLIVLHREFGEIERHTMGIQRILAEHNARAD